MPVDFELRSVLAPGNQYSALISGALDGPMPQRRISVVVRVGDDPTTSLLPDLAAGQTYNSELLDVVSVVPDARTELSGTPSGDWVVLLDGDVVIDSDLIEVFARHLQMCERGLFFLSNAGLELGSEPYPFRFVGKTHMAFSKQLLDEVGAFDDALPASAAATDWAYRAWNRGAYIVPLAHGSPVSQSLGRQEENASAELEQRCPLHFRSRDSAGPFDVPLVSIYIPAHNAVDTVVPAVRSALGQTVTDLEVCIVDDGSVDGTGELLLAEFGEDPRVRIESQANTGIGEASNRAVRMCRAPFVGQLDADDLLKPQAVERSLEVMTSDPRIGVTYTSSELIDSDGNRVGDSFEFPYFSRYELMYLMIVHHFRLFRARDWNRTSGFATDMRNAVDYDMFLKLAEVTQIVHIPEQLYQYRKHDASTSQARHAIQRANHRLAVQRSMDRQGLSADWEMVPSETVDPRDYEFQRRSEPRNVATGSEAILISIGAGKDATPALGLVAHLFPSWEVTVAYRDGENRVDSPWLAHAAGMDALEQLVAHLPRQAIRLVYQ